MLKLVVTEFAEIPAWLARRPDVALDYRPGLCGDAGALDEAIADADALIVRNATQVTRDLLRRAPRLRAIGRLGTGLDNVDCQAARDAGLPVIYAPGANAQAVAEYCIGQIIAAARHLHVANTSTRAGEWRREQLIGRAMRELTVGIVGFGQIGQKLSALAATMGAPTLVCSRHLGRAPDQGLVSAEHLFSAADVVSVHLASTPETRHSIGTPLLSLLKPHAIFLNTSRGDIVDEDALYHVAAARPDRTFILDVRATEPASDPRLASLPNVVLSPHTAALTQHTQASISDIVFGQILATLQHASEAARSAPLSALVSANVDFGPSR